MKNLAGKYIKITSNVFNPTFIPTANMNIELKDQIIFSLCAAQIAGIYKSLRRLNQGPSREAASAWLQLTQTLFELACGAAVRSGINRASTDPLVTLVDDIKEYLDWNTGS